MDGISFESSLDVAFVFCLDNNAHLVNEWGRF